MPKHNLEPLWSQLSEHGLIGYAAKSYESTRVYPLNIRIYPSKPEKVYLYGTCLIDTLYPDSGIDAIEVLEALGIEVLFVQEQTCCGQPAYNSGYREQAKAVARSQMALFNEPYPIVVLSGSCGGMMRHHYKLLFNDDAKVSDFSERIFEFSEFLLHVVQVKLNDAGATESVALHTSCAARREMAVHHSSRKLLQQLRNVQLIEHEKESECCGFGGTFAVKHADISGAMVADKCNHLVATGVERFVSADWGCMMNINGALQSQGRALRGEHVASFIRRRCHFGD